MERTELALVQRRGTTADKLALLPHEPIRAGWTKSTARNKMRLLIRRQQAGAAEEPVEGDIRHRCVGPLGVGRSRDSCPRVAEGERGPTDVCVMSSACSLRSERGGKSQRTIIDFPSPEMNQRRVLRGVSVKLHTLSALFPS